MRLTIFTDVKATALESHDIEWSTLVNSCIDSSVYPTKQSCPLIKLAVFGNEYSPRGSLRHDNNILSVSGVECDYDAGLVDPGTAAALLEHAGITALVYTSPSHATDAPRWRVLAPLSREYAPHERREFVARINGALGGIIAYESFTLSQSFYIGRVENAEYQVFSIQDQFVDLIYNLPVVYPTVGSGAARTESRIVTDETIEELRSALSAIDADDYHEWIAIGQALYELGDAGFLLWCEWSATSAKFDGGERWETFTADRTGFEAVFAKAQRNGWVNPKARKEIDTAAVFAKPTEVVPFVGGFASVQQQEEMFKGCVYIESVNQILAPGGKLLDKARFDVRYGGYSFSMDEANSKTEKSAWTAITQSQARRCVRVSDMCFRPELPYGTIVGDAVNTYFPIETPCMIGDVRPFLIHLEKLLPLQSDRDILLAYMAAIVQHPGAKFQWAPVLQGTKGNGKTFFISVMEAIVGERYSFMPDAKGLDSNFNAWIDKRLFIGIEEISVYNKRETMESLLTKITNRRISVEAKRVDQTMADNRANFIFCTNPKNGVPIDANERRYAIFYTAQQDEPDLARDGMDGRYFPTLYHWARHENGFAFIHHFLKSYTIPDELNPATHLMRAPKTSSTGEALELSMGPIEQEILEAIARGEPGFCGGWLSSIMLSRLLERHKRLSVRQQCEIIESLGYIKHPVLKDGRTNDRVMPDNGKTRLYVTKDHLSGGLVKAADVARAYQTAQGVGFGQQSMPVRQHGSVSAET